MAHGPAIAILLQPHPLVVKELKIALLYNNITLIIAVGYIIIHNNVDIKVIVHISLLLKCC